jgi:uncharacterized protein Yka (UPF0111/DUF47 family)
VLVASPVLVAIINKPARKSLAVIEEQVANDHTSNLRVDIDRLESKVDRISDLLADHLIASSRSDTAHAERLTNFIERVNQERAPQRRLFWRKE